MRVRVREGQERRRAEMGVEEGQGQVSNQAVACKWAAVDEMEWRRIND